MMTQEECLARIQLFNQQDLIRLWQDIITRSTAKAGWLPGKAFELLILQAFKLEGAEVIWPFEVRLFDSLIEQIDGVIHLGPSTFSILVESKDLNSAINIEPIAKMRSQLQRRSNATIGSVFSVNGFTEPALTLARFMAPQTILLWNKEDIGYCLINHVIIKSFTLKYRHHVEHGLPDFSIVPLI